MIWCGVVATLLVSGVLPPALAGREGAIVHTDRGDRRGYRASMRRSLDPLMHSNPKSRRVARRGGVTALLALLVTSGLAASATVPRSASPLSQIHPPPYLTPIGDLVGQNYLPAPDLLGDLGPVGVPVGAPKPPAAPDLVVANEQGPAIAQYGGAAGTLTPAALATLALEHGCQPAQAVTATAISMAESAGSPSAQGDIGLMTPVWDWSAGLWQIRGLRAERNTGRLRDSVANQDVNHNAASMYTISQGCIDWTPWSTYNNGAYLSYQALAQRAVEYVINYFNAHGRRYPPVPAPDPNSAIPVRSTGRSADVAAPQSATVPSGSARAKGARPSTSTSLPASTAAAAPRQSSPAPGQVPTSTSQAVAPVKTTTLPLPIPTLPQLPTTLPIPLPTVTLTHLP